MKTKATFIIGAILLFVIVADFISIKTFFNRLSIVGIIIIPFIYYLLFINPFKKKGLTIIFLYPILAILTILNSLFFNKEYLIGTPLLIFFLIAYVLGYIIFKTKQKATYITIYILFFLSSCFFFTDINNYLYDKFKRTDIILQLFPEVTIKDKNNVQLKIKQNNKIQVIDFWSNTCGSCIKSFPKFEKLHRYYKNSDDVIIYAININKGSLKETQKAESFLKNYTFKNYFTDPSIYKILKFNGVPNYLIINKTGKIIYFGSLNDGITENYNNIYKLIENER